MPPSNAEVYRERVVALEGDRRDFNLMLWAQNVRRHWHYMLTLPGADEFTGAENAIQIKCGGVPEK